MWTKENRGRFDRCQQRYPSDLTAEEWRLVEPLIPSAKRGGGNRRIDMREVENGLMYILPTRGSRTDTRTKSARDAFLNGLIRGAATMTRA
jgi:transposase